MPYHSMGDFEVSGLSREFLELSRVTNSVTRIANEISGTAPEREIRFPASSYLSKGSVKEHFIPRDSCSLLIGNRTSPKGKLFPFISQL
mmetsp:Transcript_16191/g.28658  ORF Transcript_16191/g.28658 Transcript_16191/m.28658 type:complete len:89 (-) Transcript_16191:2362-2628(-)